MTILKMNILANVILVMHVLTEPADRMKCIALKIQSRLIPLIHSFKKLSNILRFLIHGLVQICISFNTTPWCVSHTQHVLPKLTKYITQWSIYHRLHEVTNSKYSAILASIQCSPHSSPDITTCNNINDCIKTRTLKTLITQSEHIKLKSES